MKKYSVLALSTILVLAPICSLADNDGQKVTNPTSTAYTGFVTAINLNPAFTGYTPSINFVAGGSGAYTLTLQTNQSLIAAPITTGTNSFISIKGFSIECLPYNPALVGSTGYLYSAESNGVAGGTVTIHEYKPSGAAVTVGTVVLPTSPHNGPYVNTAVSTLISPYVPTTGSVFDAYVTSFNATPTVQYNNCVVTATLQ